MFRPMSTLYATDGIFSRPYELNNWLMLSSPHLCAVYAEPMVSLHGPNASSWGQGLLLLAQCTLDP